MTEAATPAGLARSDLYEDDIVVWSDRQAALLRRLAAGERVDEQIDWGNVIEEIELVGGSQRSAVESLLRRAMEHLLKMHGWPNGPVEHWSAEARTLLRDAGHRWAPSMASVIDLNKLYAASAADVSVRRMQGRPPRPPPAGCPFAASDLVVNTPVPIDVDALLAKLSA